MTTKKKGLLHCIIFLSLCILFLSSCATRKLSSSAMVIPENFDWQGHRGCRGLMPENTVPAFLEALRYPVTTLELDVVMSKDGKLIVSHEPWMNATICTDPDAHDIPESKRKKHNLYALTLDQIQRYDCGSKGNPKFPRQQKVHANKPTLEEVVSEVKEYCNHSGRPMPVFNIEVKSKEDWYDVFVPKPGEFVTSVLQAVRGLQIEDKVILQSFDLVVLHELYRQRTGRMAISYLVESEKIEKNLEQLGFDPEIYSPRYRLINAKLIKFAHERSIKVIPWTVNDTKRIRKLIQLGVDGIITDYPDLIEKVLTNTPLIQ